MYFKDLLFSLALIAPVVTAQKTTISTPASAPTANPCAVISSSARSVLSQDPAATPSLVPSIVYACQQDVPVNDTLVVEQIAILKAFVSLQSTLVYLKDPPVSYDLPAVDVLAGLDAIGAKALASGYHNEFEVEYDIYNLISRAGDGHLTTVPYLIGAFAYATGVNLVSISPDGIQTPSIYSFSDLSASSKTDLDSSSANVAINGVDIETYLAEAGFYAPFQDLDARYNSLLYSPSTTAANHDLPIGFYYTTTLAFYHNDTTIYSFSHGSSRTVQNFVVPKVDIDFDSGSALFSQHLLPPSKAQAASASQAASPSESAAPTAIPGYPSSFVSQVQNIVSGYFLNGTGNDNVAVLSITSFDVTTEPEAASFQDTVREFITACKSLHKTRLIIDVRGNGGGDLILPIDTFKQLFPSKTPYSGIRWPLTDAANTLGTEISKITPSILKQYPALLTAYNSLYNSQDSLTSPSGHPFQTWEALANPPVMSHGANFTKVVSWNFNNRALDDSLGITPSGYLNNTNVPSTQPFASQNITVLTDGACSSACAAFVNLLLRQGGAKSVVAGGRPNTKPMAIIGGTQGGEEQSMAVIQSYAKSAAEIFSATNKQSVISSVPGYETLKLLLQDTPLALWKGLDFQKVNIRDNIAPGDASMTPLQFVKMEADCRMFYMARDLFDVGYTWQRVFDGVKKGGEGFCIDGTVSKWGVGDSNGTVVGGSNGTVGSSGSKGPAFTGSGVSVANSARAVAFGLVFCLLMFL